MTPGADVAVSIRPHDVGLSAGRPQGGINVVPAVVTRQVFLGGTRDYVVETKDGAQLRALTAASENIPTGTNVWLNLPPDRCRALRR
jgi:iron(III) transport system ATP-binding protein